jgi:hypothetical protein
MTPTQAVLFFVEKLNEGAFLSYCTATLCASIVEGDHCDLRWRGEDATVWARDVRGTLSGDFVVPQDVTKCLGVAPQSAIVLELGEHPSSGYAGFLVAVALLRQWTGCVTTPGDPAVFSSESLKDPLKEDLALRSLFGRGSHE